MSEEPGGKEKKPLKPLKVETFYECVAGCDIEITGKHAVSKGEILCREVQVPVALSAVIAKSRANFESGNFLKSAPGMGMGEWLEALRELGDFIEEKLTELEGWEIGRERIPRRLAGALLAAYRVERRP